MKKPGKQTWSIGRAGRAGGADPAAKVRRGRMAAALGAAGIVLAIGLIIALARRGNHEFRAHTYTPRARGLLTFNKDIAPIVFSRCAGCHRPDQAAPFSLLNFQDVKKRAKQIEEVTSKRYMPPWLPEPGIVDFANERRLSADELGMIQQWVSEGAAEGDAADLPPAPKRTEGWQLGEPDLVVKMPRAYTLPPEGKDVYRNFVIPIPISETKHVKAVEFLAGSLKTVHHAFLKVDPTRESQRLDDQDPEPGFNFMITPITAQIPEGHFLSWTPGRIAPDESEELAWRLEKGTDLVLQLHMRPTGKPETIQAAVGFHFTNRASTNTPFKILLTSRALDIPAGEKDYRLKDAFTLPIDVELRAVLPHAHYLGKEMRGVATLPDGTKQPLLQIKNWDFNWQSDFRYARPIFLPKGTTLSMEFSYDNSASNERNPNHPPRRVTYGPETADEMAELWFQVLLRRKDDLPALVQAFQRKTLAVRLDQYAWAARTKPNEPETRNELGKALLGLGRDAEAVSQFQMAAALRSEFEEPHFLLGYLFRKQKKLGEARREYEHVLRINPTNHEAHGNLGLVFLELGQLDQAEVQFQNALRVNPADAVARRNLDVVLEAKRRNRAKP